MFLPRASFFGTWLRGSTSSGMLVGAEGAFATSQRATWYAGCTSPAAMLISDRSSVKPFWRKMGILAWIVLGLIAGAIAKAIMPGNDPGGIIVTMVIGIIGALIGGFLGSTLMGARL